MELKQKRSSQEKEKGRKTKNISSKEAKFPKK